MVNSLTVINSFGESLTIDLHRPEDSGILITNIDGLSGAQNQIASSSYANLDGCIVTSSKLDALNLTIEYDITGESTVKVEATRAMIYRAFQTKTPIVLIFETDLKTVCVEGRVEKREHDTFKDMVTGQISIMCPNPYFIEYGASVVEYFSGVSKSFTFPYSNESLTEKLTEFGALYKIEQKDCINEGDHDAGLSINMSFKGSVGDITVYNFTTGEDMIVRMSKALALTGYNSIAAGDHIFINTRPGEKGIYFTRQGVTKNILAALDPMSEWMHLAPGDNIVGYAAASGSLNLDLELSYERVFEGI